MTTLEELKNQLREYPETVEFDQVINAIANNYSYTPGNFSNGKGADRIENSAGSNEGSCRIFAFAKLNQLDKISTLACFGHYYREEVLKNPNGNDHANIRNFIRDGWDGITFDQQVLKPKA